MTGRIRDGRPADLPALRAIQAASLAEPWPDLLNVAPDGPPILLVADARGSEAASPEATPSEAGATPSEAGATPTDPVGYALAMTAGDEAVGYLVELAVAPDHRDEGRGSALLSTLVDRLRDRDVERLRVTVRTADERARSFYVSHGFERSERLPDHYESGDGLLLVRDVE